MPTRLLLLALLLLATALGGCGGGGLDGLFDGGSGQPQLPDDGGAGAEMSDEERAYAEQVLALVNEERVQRSLAPLAWHEGAAGVGQRHNRDMRDRGFFDHVNPDGDGPGDRIAAAGIPHRSWGENIARGQPTPEAVMAAWMGSEGHRNNILRSSFTHLGVGVLLASGGPWWTQVFLSQ